ncbi:MAG: hypothetical protein ABIW17_00580 [Marmoricola sp.]
MKYKIRVAALSASVLIVLAGGHAIRASSAEPESNGTRPLPLVEASLTVPGQKDPVVVHGGLSTNTRGLARASAAAVRSTQDVRPELINAYTRAVAVAPAACNLSLSLLAAIGQVESGNLATETIDAQNRVVPGILGPVLDGDRFAKIPDTDDGRWDGNKDWDRALGPMQFVPASWRVVGLDLDDDGVRDPQDIFDAAGAAMVYLCASGRDLATSDGLTEAVLAYNHSVRYLHIVLGWKTVFDAADLTGLPSAPALGAWAMPALPDETQLTNAAAGQTRHSSPPKSKRSTSSEPTGGSSTPAGTPPASNTGPAVSSDPGTPPAVPSPSADPDPGTAPDPTSHPTPDPTPDPSPDPSLTCLPDPSVSPEPGAAEPSVIPTVIPSVIPGDGTPPDPCALLTPSESASPDAVSPAQ